MHAFWGVLYWGSLLQACVTSVIQGVGVTVMWRGLGIQKSLAGGQDKSTWELRKIF